MRNDNFQGKCNAMLQLLCKMINVAFSLKKDKNKKTYAKMRKPFFFKTIAISLNSKSQ